MKVKMIRSNQGAISSILKYDLCLLAAQRMLHQFCYTLLPGVGAGVQKL